MEFSCLLWEQAKEKRRKEEMTYLSKDISVHPTFG
jgi:hypothetical protein